MLTFLYAVVARSLPIQRRHGTGVPVAHVRERRSRLGLGAGIAAIAAVFAVIAAFTRFMRCPQKGATLDGPQLSAVSREISFRAPEMDAALWSLEDAPPRHRRPACGFSDDPDYSCHLARPPGAFDNEITIDFAVTEEHLSVKVVVPGKSEARRAGHKAEGWVALGFSPDGKMAGPSEAVVGHLGVENDEPVLRHRMDGYRATSVTPLPKRNQLLMNESIETEADGSLVLRFLRPHAGGHCAPLADEVGVSIIESGEQRSDLPWYDPRQGGVFVIWAYSSRGSWPSYHDATGAFVLPQLQGEAR